MAHDVSTGSRERRPKVLIIGGGFGGLFCARRLGKVGVDVTLLDRAACHVFQSQVPTQ